MANSKVKSVFQSLPPEIRNEIYGYLFGKNCRLELIDKSHPYDELNPADWSEEHGATSKFGPVFGYIVGCRRHSAILRTCWQIYQETIPIVYGSTVFSFRNKKPLVFISRSNEARSLPFQCLQHVQKLEISVEHDEPQYSTWRGERMAFLIREAGALTQLRLSFYISALWAIGGMIDVWAQEMIYERGIPEFVKSSRSLLRVEITVTNTRDVDAARYSEPLVHAITTTEDWSCEQHHEPLVKAKARVDKDGYPRPECDYGHKWTWNLRSAPSEPLRDVE